MHDIVVDAHEAAMKTGDRALSLVGAACLRSSRLPDCSLRSNAPLVAVGGSLTLGMEASPQAEHVSRHGTHWLFVSCRALIGLARIQRRRKFEQLVDENKIAEVLVGQETIQGILKVPFPDGRKMFYTVRVEPGLADKLRAHGVVITGAPSSTILSTILSWVLPIFIFYLIWTYGIRRMAERQGFGGLMAIGKSRAKVYVETDTKVTFRDVAGVDEAKSELQELVAFLRDPASFGRLGARIPKGILLVGPPGTGKTLLARAVAGEAGVPFFSISAPSSSRCS